MGKIRLKKQQKGLVNMYANYVKRLIDFLLALLLVIPAVAILIIFSIPVFLFLGRPIFFKQQRPGLHGKLFVIYKLRTMTDQCDESGNLLPDSQRLTRLGRLIRKLSVDELPQIWNVIKGEMSFVGPRPLLPEYLKLYTKDQAHRHDVRPGITGLAQVSGRNNISWNQKFRYDIHYVDNLSFRLDVQILIKTIVKIIKRSDISAKGEATVGKFRGDQQGDVN